MDAESMSKPCLLPQLPPEILVLICQYIPFHGGLLCLRRACRALAQYLHSGLWVKNFQSFDNLHAMGRMFCLRPERASPPNHTPFAGNQQAGASNTSPLDHALLMCGGAGAFQTLPYHHVYIEARPWYTYSNPRRSTARASYASSPEMSQTTIYWYMKAESLQVLTLEQAVHLISSEFETFVRAGSGQRRLADSKMSRENIINASILSGHIYKRMVDGDLGLTEEEDQEQDINTAEMREEGSSEAQIVRVDSAEKSDPQGRVYEPILWERYMIQPNSKVHRIRYESNVIQLGLDVEAQVARVARRFASLLEEEDTSGH